MLIKTLINKRACIMLALEPMLFEVISVKIIRDNLASLLSIHSPPLALVPTISLRNLRSSCQIWLVLKFVVFYTMRSFLN